MKLYPLGTTSDVEAWITDKDTLVTEFTVAGITFRIYDKAKGSREVWTSEDLREPVLERIRPKTVGKKSPSKAPGYPGKRPPRLVKRK